VELGERKKRGGKRKEEERKPGGREGRYSNQMMTSVPQL